MSLDFLHEKGITFTLSTIIGSLRDHASARWLVGDFSPQRPDFDFRPIHAGFMMDMVAQGQTFLRVLRCFQFMSFHETYKLTNLLPPRYLSNWQCCRSQWPRDLRRRSAAARLLRLCVRILLGVWRFVCCECVCCQVKFSATSRLLVQRSHTGCGASLCVI